MTVLHVKNQLVTHFLSHDTFDPVNDWSELEYEQSVAPYRAELVEAALSELESAGYVKRLTKATQGTESGGTIYVLTRPIHDFVQQVPVGPLVAGIIADLINSYNEIEGIDAQCDQMRLSEDDLIRLSDIIGQWEEEAVERSKAEKGGGS